MIKHREAKLASRRLGSKARDAVALRLVRWQQRAQPAAAPPSH
jgi:hypothetical protein